MSCVIKCIVSNTQENFMYMLQVKFKFRLNLFQPRLFFLT